MFPFSISTSSLPNIKNRLEKRLTAPLDAQEAGRPAQALPAPLLLLHRPEQRRPTGERRSLQQHGAAQHTGRAAGQLCLSEPHSQATAQHPHTEDAVAANSAHGERVLPTVGSGQSPTPATPSWSVCLFACLSQAHKIYGSFIFFLPSLKLVR